jgi:general stress protein YciG
MSRKQKTKQSVKRKNQGPRKPQGFAVISEERRKEIATMGGKASAASGRAHKWTKAQAQEMGKKGGLKSAKKRREAMKARKLAG